jgi:hypothetical protein
MSEIELAIGSIMRSLDLIFSVFLAVLLLDFSGPSAQAQKEPATGPVQIRFTSAVADTDRGEAKPPAAAPGSKEYLLQQLNKGFSLPAEQRPTKLVFLAAVMGTPGPGDDVWTRYKARAILGGPHERIVVEAAFPHQAAKGKPIVVRGFLKPDD